MSTFILTISLDDHDHSPRAHRHAIGTALDSVKARVGSTEDVEGSITDHSVPFTHKVVGSWKIIGEE